MPIYKGQEIMQRILEQESTRMMSELTTQFGKNSIRVGTVVMKPRLH